MNTGDELFGLGHGDSVCRKLRTRSSLILHYRSMPVQWHDALMDMRARIIAVIESKADMSVRKVSLAAGLSDSMLHKFLTGATDSITIKNAEKLATALKVDPRWLIFGEGDPEEASDIANLIRRIPPEWHDKAIAVLEAFARPGTHG